MDPIAIISLVAGSVTAIGGFVGGRRMAASSALNVAQQTVGMLEAQIQLMQSREREKDATIQALIERVEVLEGMVLQREDLSNMKRDISLIKVKLNA